MINPAENLWKDANELRTSKICIASSRTGARIIAPSPSNLVHLFRYKHSITGTRKLRVFPLPVLDAPKISPRNIC